MAPLWVHKSVLKLAYAKQKSSAGIYYYGMLARLWCSVPNDSSEATFCYFVGVDGNILRYLRYKASRFVYYSRWTLSTAWHSWVEIHAVYSYWMLENDTALHSARGVPLQLFCVCIQASVIKRSGVVRRNCGSSLLMMHRYVCSSACNAW